MQLRVLSADDVRAACDMRGAIDAMREAFGALSGGEATVPLRVGLDTPDGVTLFMPAHLRDSGAAAAKVVSVHPGNAERGLPVIHAVVLTLDPSTGLPTALLEGGWLTALRTGAAGGLAADLLARPDAEVVALFGAGVQARTQLEAVRCVRDVSEVRIRSRTRASAERLAGELSGVEVRLPSGADEAVDGADVVIAATSSSTPVFDGARVTPGTHVTAVGSFKPEMREVDTALVARATVFVDQREAALAEAGDLAGPIADGAVDRGVIAAELGEVVLGIHPGRTSEAEVTFFKSVGNAAQDVAVAARVVARAEERGLGSLLEL